MNTKETFETVDCVISLVCSRAAFNQGCQLLRMRKRETFAKLKKCAWKSGGAKRAGSQAKRSDQTRGFGGMAPEKILKI